MDSSKFDRLMLDTIGKTHIKGQTVYYDEEYYLNLVKHLAKDYVLNKYCAELTTNSQGVKMCSIASSSRFCYLSSKDLFDDIDELEKTNIKNGCCRPHYDGYSEKNRVFYEFKSHEFCTKSHSSLSTSYIDLLKDIFGIHTKTPSELRFSDFKMSIENDPSIYKLNFDFKQFLCHVFGLLSIVTKDQKATLKYVWIVPDLPNNEELNSFVNMIRHEQIDKIFNQFSNLTINHKDEKVKIKDLICFEFELVPAWKIKDPILEELS